jgi:hypothetical protein
MITVRRLSPDDLPRLRRFWSERWGDEFVVAHGVAYRPDDLEGFAALEGEEWVGLVTFTFIEDGWRSYPPTAREGKGIGSALIDRVVDEGAAGRAGVRPHQRYARAFLL